MFRGQDKSSGSSMARLETAAEDVDSVRFRNHTRWSGVSHAWTWWMRPFLHDRRRRSVFRSVEEKIFAAQFPDGVTKLGSFFKLKALCGFAHRSFQLGNVRIQVFFRLEAFRHGL